MQSLTPQQWGLQIEAQACEYFLKTRPNARLLERGFRCKSGEIDLIFEEKHAAHWRELVFVEVRARHPTGWVSGLESVTWPKRRKLASAIRWYLTGYREMAEAVRVDILDWNGESWTHAIDIRISG